MKTPLQIKQITALILVIILTASLKIYASGESSSSNTLINYINQPLSHAAAETKMNIQNFELINAKDSTSDLIVQYENIAVGVDVQRTYFLPGAGFDADEDRTEMNFTNEMINSWSNTIGNDFVVIKNSSKKIPIRALRAGINGRWAVMNGYKPIDPNKHGNLLRAIEEIELDFQSSKSSKTLNLVGSSYGSVIAAQSAIALIERDNDIDSIGVLAMTASMIDPASELGLKLEEFKRQGKINAIYYHPNPNDNITACSGKSKKEARQGFRNVLFGSSPSIMNMKKHIHNIAAKNTTRAHHLLNFIVNMSTITWVKKRDDNPDHIDVVLNEKFKSNAEDEGENVLVDKDRPFAVLGFHIKKEQLELNR